MPNEAAPEENNPHRGKAGVLASVKASVGAINLKGEPGQREKAWKLWRERFERAMRWMAVSDTDKLDLLLLVGGEELQKLIETLPEQPTNYESHIQKLNDYFEAHRNNTLELYKFFNIDWPIEVPFADFETKCREQGLHCEFPITIENAIIMLAVVKTKNGELRTELIRKNGDLKSVRETAKAFEMAKQGSEMMADDNSTAQGGEQQSAKDSNEVHKITRPGRYSMRNNRPESSTGRPTTKLCCTGCGNEAHPKGVICPARGKNCLRCGKSNHFARACSSRKPNRFGSQVRALERHPDPGTNHPDGESEVTEEVYLYRITGDKSSNPTVTVQVNTVPVTLHLDTQADVTVITEKHFESLKGTSRLQPTRAVIRSYSGDGPGPALPLLGCFTASLSRNKKSIVEVVYVVKGQGNTALLSRQAAENMGLVEYHIEQTTKAPSPIREVERPEINNLITEYEDVFTGIGKLKGVTVKLHVIPEAPGAIQKQRRVSIPLKEKFDQILDRWQDLDIIEDVGDEPTDWCSNVVLTPKKDGESVRASLDMTDVNKYIKRTRHTIPTLRELETRLNGAKFFSHLDMNDGYMQLELAEESRKLTTFYTHRGLKRFKRLHFGVNSAAEIFNEEVRKVVSLEPNAISIYDDVLVFGTTQEEHDQALRHILQLWRSHGLTLNMKKSRFNLRSVTFFGKVFSSAGITPDPNKVAALQAAGPPQSQAEVRSFLFFAGANADFMEGFAQTTAPLRDLIKQGAPFHWTPECQRAFEQTKTLLSGDTVMAYFDPHRKTKLMTDAGPQGLAVTLKQYDPHTRRWKPVTYRSRALTDTETRYSQLEKEAKAVEWGVLANQIYLYGLRDTFEIDTDHKPLLPLFASHKATAPLRIERMRVRLQGFDYKLNYVPGKKAKAETNEADYNSRHPEPLTTKDAGAAHQTEFATREDEELFEKDIRAVVQAALPDAVSWDELLEETSQDPELKGLKSAIARGYFTAPDRQALGPQFDSVFTELAVVGGLLVRGSRIVVPRSLRDKVVRLAHEGHQGVTKTKEYLRTRVWFPGLDRMVEAHIQHCHPCQVVTPANEREPLRMSALPREPWKEVAIDFWGPINTGEYLLVVICKQSRWVEVEFVSTTSGRAVLPKLDRIFSSLGIPLIVGSDNGPPFSGQDFMNFSTYLGFKHERKTPKNPQANAEAEQFMRVLKKLYRICQITGQVFRQEVHRFLRCYRATPHGTTRLAPAELMFPGRKFRTRLPIGVVPRHLDFEELFQHDLAKKMQMKAYADRKKNVKTSNIQVGDAVLVKQELSGKSSSPYEGEPLEVQYRKGTQVVAQRRDGSTVTRSTAHFKKVPYQTPEEAGRWGLGPDPGHDHSADPKARELPRQQEHREKVRSSERQLSEHLDSTEPLAECVDEAPRALLPPDTSDRSSRPRRSADEYLRSKYPDCVLPDRIQ